MSRFILYTSYSKRHTVKHQTNRYEVLDIVLEGGAQSANCLNSIRDAIIHDDFFQNEM